MVTETGKVIEIKGDKAVVRFERKTACDNCKMCLMRKKDMHIDMPMENKVGAKVDDSVVVEIKKGNLTFAAALVYGVPLLVMVLAVVIAYLLDAKEYVIGIVAVAAGVLAYATLFVVNKYVSLRHKPDPAIVKIVTEKKSGFKT